MKKRKRMYIQPVCLLLVFVWLVSCKGKDPVEPVDTMTWQPPVETAYEFSMTYVTQLAFPEGISKNQETTLGAFRGEECRGLARLQSEGDIHLCFLTIFSNEISGEWIEIKAFDADKKKIYNNCTTIHFSSGGRQGAESEVLHCR